MGIENCELIKRARDLAIEKGLNPNSVVCPGCVPGTDCPFSANNTSSQVLNDQIQEAALNQLEGEANIRRFYGKIEAHFEKISRRNLGH